MKKITYTLLIFIMLFTFIPNVFADSYIVLNAKKYFRDEPSGN